MVINFYASDKEFLTKRCISERLLAIACIFGHVWFYCPLPQNLPLSHKNELILLRAILQRCAWRGKWNKALGSNLLPRSFSSSRTPDAKKPALRAGFSNLVGARG
jgi:hypothetical protein